MVLELAEPVQVTAGVLGHPSEDAVSETELRILNVGLREGFANAFPRGRLF